MTAPRAFRLAEIVEHLGGELAGDPGVAIERVASLESAGPGDIAFLSQAKFRSKLSATRAAALILPRAERDATRVPRILCDDPYVYFARVSALLNPPAAFEPGVHASAVVEAGARIAGSAHVGPGCHVGRNAQLGEDVCVEAGCAIGDEVRIGEGSRLHPCVVVYARCAIGKRAIIHSGAVIGADGFGMAAHEGRWLKIPQVGRVVIGDDVEVGAGTTIDRGTLDDTVIEDGVKLDNQIQIGHNVRVGAHTAMAGCVGVAGSARIGRHCTFGGAAMVLGHLEIADDVHVSAGSLVTKSIPEPGTYTGVFPIQAGREWRRTAALLKNIDKLEARVRVLERIIAKLHEKE